MQPSLASGIWPAATLLLHSGYVLAAGAALIAALAITAASVCLTRKHLTWGVYLDMPPRRAHLTAGTGHGHPDPPHHPDGRAGQQRRPWHGRGT